MSPSRKREGPHDDTVLTPEDLDISSEERVAEIEEGRYVIGADKPPNPDAASVAKDSEPMTLEDLQEQTREDQERKLGIDEDRELTGAEVKRWINEELARTDSQYAFRIAAKTGNSTGHQQLASDDIAMAFDGLLMWYAQQVGRGTSVEEALGILLAESNIRVRYPVTGVIAFLQQHDLDPDDSIADLLTTIRENRGIEFPNRDRR